MENTQTLSQLKEIDMESCVALQEYFASRSVIITSETPGFDHGTGIAVRYRNEHYILTAAHVLRQEPRNDKILVIGKPDSVLKEVRKDELAGAFFAGAHGHIKYSTASYISIIDRLEDDRLGDIAALKVRQTTHDLPYTEFHDLSGQGQAVISEGKPVVICGFPGALAQHARHVITEQQGVVTTIYNAFQHIRGIPESLAQLDPSIHFVTNFTHDIENFDPKGMSGGGAWSVPNLKNGEVWSPDQTQLLGIQSAFSRNRKLMVLVRIERMFDLLSGN